MTDELAERLLAKVMGWSSEEVRDHLPTIQALAAWKYDDYERFSHGMRFVESLALWLDQFEIKEERRVAFEFVRNRLVVLSEPEVNHLVEMAYPDYIRPHLLNRVAQVSGQALRQPRMMAAQAPFRVHQRQCLFLGLSDGARTDVFRRSNNSDLTNEQILLTYEIEEGRAEKLLKELQKGLLQLTGTEPAGDTTRFTTVVLLDDFSASGKSYLRVEGDRHDGKIGRFYRNLFTKGTGTTALFNTSALDVLLVLYAGTSQARLHLEEHMAKLWDPHGIRWKVMIVYELADDLRLTRGSGDPMEALVEKYYDPAIQDEHTNVGGTEDIKYGFAHCGLPVVLPHNTPNNSVALLWAEINQRRALFPRVQRHRRQS